MSISNNWVQQILQVKSPEEAGEVFKTMLTDILKERVSRGLPIPLVVDGDAGERLSIMEADEFYKFIQSLMSTTFLGISAHFTAEINRLEKISDQRSLENVTLLQEVEELKKRFGIKPTTLN